MNIRIQVLCGHVSISPGYIPKRENDGSCCNSFLLILHIKVMSGTQIQCYFQCSSIAHLEGNLSLILALFGYLSIVLSSLP